MDGKLELKELALQYMRNGQEAIEKNQLEEAIRMFQDAVHLFKRCEEERMYILCLHLLGIMYENTGSTFMAVDNYLEGLDIAKRKEYDSYVAMFYNNIGTRYQKLGEHKIANRFFQKAEEALIREKSKGEENHFEEEYQVQRLRTYINFALSYNKISDLNSAQNYLEQAQEVFQVYGLEKYANILLILSCKMRWKMGKSDSVRKDVKKLLDFVEGTKELTDYIQTVQETASLFKSMKEFKAWKRLLKCAEEEAERRDNLYFRLVSAEMWIDYYHNIKDMDSYFNACVEYIEVFREQKKINDGHQILALDLKLALREMELQRRILEKESKQDPVTDIGNRHCLEIDSELFVQNAVREEESVIVGIIDIDYFKQVNDTYGHVHGDKCLKLTAQVIQKCIHGYGEVYRYGGDEFVLLINEAEEEVAHRLAKRIRQKINESWMRKDGHNTYGRFTLSQGYACFQPKKGERLADILAYADRALYIAKEAGRDNYKIRIEKDH